MRDHFPRCVLTPHRGHGHYHGHVFVKSELRVHGLRTRYTSPVEEITVYAADET